MDQKVRLLLDGSGTFHLQICSSYIWQSLKRFENNLFWPVLSILYELLQEVYLIKSHWSLHSMHVYWGLGAGSYVYFIRCLSWLLYIMTCVRPVYAVWSLIDYHCTISQSSNPWQVSYNSYVCCMKSHRCHLYMRSSSGTSVYNTLRS